MTEKAILSLLYQSIKSSTKCASLPTSFNQKTEITTCLQKLGVLGLNLNVNNYIQSDEIRFNWIKPEND